MPRPKVKEEERIKVVTTFKKDGNDDNICALLSKIKLAEKRSQTLQILAKFGIAYLLENPRLMAAFFGNEERKLIIESTNDSFIKKRKNTKSCSKNNFTYNSENDESFEENIQEEIIESLNNSEKISNKNTENQEEFSEQKTLNNRRSNMSDRLDMFSNFRDN